MRSLGRKRTRSQVAIEKSIETVLIEVQPLLRMEHCRLELTSFTTDTGVLVVSIEGSCSDCEVSPATFSTAIAAHVKQRVPEVLNVRFAD